MVEKVAGMSEECPNWGMLDEIGLTDDVLREVVVNDSLPVNYSDSSSLPDLPSHGILIELYYFCQRFSALSKSKVNFILKKCIDVLFPSCVVSRADRLERRIRGLCLSVESMSKQDLVLFLQKHWRPQPTGTCTTTRAYKLQRRRGHSTAIVLCVPSKI